MTSPFRNLYTLLVVVGLACGIPVRAEDDGNSTVIEPGQHNQHDDGSAGDGGEEDHHDGADGEHHDEIRLQPTTAAPVDARGEAQIKQDAATAPLLNVEVQGLVAGTYTTSVTSLATGAVTVVGTFNVADLATDEADTEASLLLPAGLDPLDIGSVQILDAAGVLLLSGDGVSRGGEIDGSEHLHQNILLIATADAPAGLQGKAELEAEDNDGTSAAHLEIKAHGLVTGTYSVSVTSLATGLATVLGTFDSAGTGKDEVEFGGDDGSGFPAGFNPLDIATVQILDAGGVVLLSGDFSNAATVAATSFIAKVRITPGAAAPNSKGSAILAVRVNRHLLRQKFALIAKGAPAKTTLTMKINGVTAGTVKTNRVGGFVVNKLPKGVLAHKITSVTFENAAGSLVFSARF